MEPATSGNLGVPSIGIAGLSSIGTSNNPQWRGDNTVQLSDGLTWVHGSHTAKVGFDALDFFKHSFFVSTGRGSFTFNGEYTGGPGNLQNEFADFLLGTSSRIATETATRINIPFNTAERSTLR